MFRAVAPQGPCENLLCAFKLLAIVQAGGDNLVDKGQSRFHVEAMEIGDLEKNSEAIKVVRPKFNKEIFWDAIIRDLWVN